MSGECTFYILKVPPFNHQYLRLKELKELEMSQCEKPFSQLVGGVLEVAIQKRERERERNQDKAKKNNMRCYWDVKE